MPLRSPASKKNGKPQIGWQVLGLMQDGDGPVKRWTPKGAGTVPG